MANLLFCETTTKYYDGNFYVGDKITIHNLGGNEYQEKVEVYANDIFIDEVSSEDGGELSWEPKQAGTYVFKQVAKDGSEEYLHKYVGSTQTSRNYVLTVKDKPEKFYKLYYKIKTGYADPYGEKIPSFGDSTVMYHTYNEENRIGELWFSEKIQSLEYTQTKNNFTSFKIDDVDEIKNFVFNQDLRIGNNVKKVTKLKSLGSPTSIKVYNSSLKFEPGSLTNVNGNLYLPSDFDETTIETHYGLNIMKYDYPSVSLDIVGEARIGHILTVKKDLKYRNEIFTKVSFDYTLFNRKYWFSTYKDWSDDHLFITDKGDNKWDTGGNTISPKVIFSDDFSEIRSVPYKVFKFDVAPKREERCIVKYLVQEENKDKWICKNALTTGSQQDDEDYKLTYIDNPLLADKSRWDGNWYIAKYEYEVGAFGKDQLVWSPEWNKLVNNYVEAIVLPEGFEKIQHFALGANQDENVLRRVKITGDTPVVLENYQHGNYSKCGQNTDKQKFIVIIPDGNKTVIPRLTGSYYEDMSFWGWTNGTKTTGWWPANDVFNMQMEIDYNKELPDL